MKFLFLFMMLFYSVYTYANEDFNNKNINNYDDVFSYMQTNGIILDEDIPMNELFSMIESGKIFDNNGNINNKVLDVKLSKYIKIKDEAYNKIREEISINPNHPINKEVQYYLDDNNYEIQNAKEELNEKDKSWQTNIINYVLDLMKY